MNIMVYLNTLTDEEFHLEKETTLKSGVCDALRGLKYLTESQDRYIKSYDELNIDEIREQAKDIIKACDGGFIEEYRQVVKRKK